MWDIVQQTKVGDRGVAYVVNAEGRVIAHPDFGVRKSLRDLSSLAHVQEARTSPSTGWARIARDMNDQKVVAPTRASRGGIMSWRRQERQPLQGTLPRAVMGDLNEVFNRMILPPRSLVNCPVLIGA